jgi:hypothetical protein
LRNRQNGGFGRNDNIAITHSYSLLLGLTQKQNQLKFFVSYLVNCD